MAIFRCIPGLFSVNAAKQYRKWSDQKSQYEILLGSSVGFMGDHARLAHTLDVASLKCISGPVK